MENLEDKPFRPWLGDLQLAGLTFAVSGLAVLVGVFIASPSVRVYSLTTATTFALVCIYFLRRCMTRIHGKASEARALRKLDALLKDGWVLQRNVMLPSGDLDGLLKGPDDTAFALEIKSKASLRILKGTLWNKDKLVDVKGRPIDQKLFQQAKSNAFQVNAFAVLWFPDAKEAAYSRDIENVAVVCGPPRQLLKALRIPAKTWWSK